MMSDLSKRLKQFEKRVRIVRAWRGFAVGACAGAAASAIWAVLDWRAVAYTEWAWMGSLTGACAIIGAVIGFSLRIPVQQLAESIDRRAGLDDRLSTAHERESQADRFDGAQRADAMEKLAGIKPRSVYPLKVGKWHAGAVILSIVAAAIFVLGNTPIALSEEAKKDREELKKEGETVKRVTKQNFETAEAKQEMSDAERRLADEMRRFDRDLEKARISKEEAFQKSNELSQKADDLMKQAAQESQATLAQAETARQQLEKGEMEKAGIDSMTAQMAQMPEAERQSRLDQAKRDGKKLESKIDALKRKLEELNNKLANKNLTEAERKALEAQKSAIEKQLKSLQDELSKNSETQKSLELSKAAQDVFKKMMQDPIYKELIEIEKKLAQNTASAGKPGGRPKLTDEEREQIKKKLEELAAKLKDAKAMNEYLEKLLEAMKEANKLGRCNGACLGIGGMLSLGGNSLQQAPAGPGAPSEDIWMGDSGHIHKLEKPEASRGATTTDVISGDAKPSTGAEPYVEIKAPSMVGNRTSVPYREVLPSYKKKAESALSRQQIPKEHQKRVKEYFDSLTGAGKS